MNTFKEKQRLCAKRRVDLISRATPAELHTKQLLDELKIKYVFQKGFIVGNNFCIVDFYLPRPYRICLEIDGEYHQEPKQQIRDKSREDYLHNKRGFNILRISNTNILSMNSEQLSKLISTI